MPATSTQSTLGTLALYNRFDLYRLLEDEAQGQTLPETIKTLLVRAADFEYEDPATARDLRDLAMNLCFYLH
jgi:hypothetical protein